MRERGVLHLSPPDSTRNDAGFSLMELIVVLVLLAIISAAVVPVYSGSVESVHAGNTQRDIVALLKYAQERAISDAVEYRFYLKSDARRYWIMRQTVDEDGQIVFERPPEKSGRDRVLPDFVAIAGTRKMREDREWQAHYIGFYPNGSCDTTRIKLEIENGPSLRIEIEGGLGEIEVSEK